MHWESCKIMLNSDSTGTVYAGDIVTGTVTFDFNKETKIDNIFLHIIGTCEAQWTRSRPTMPYIKIYSEKIKLFYVEMDISGSISGRTVSPGFVDFPFHFVLPDDLPSTFESSYCKINYHIKIHTKGKRKKKMQFAVLGNVNLNDIEEFLYPASYIFQKVCWNSKSLTVRLKTYTGFASRQIIPFQVIIDNENKIQIRKIKVALIQKLRYTITEGHMEEERKVCQVQYNKTENTVHEECDFSMELPSLTPSTFSIFIDDPVIFITYVFRIQVIFLFHSSIYEDIPVTVATAPVVHNDFECIDTE